MMVIGCELIESLPSRVMPGFLGTPAGMMTTSAPVRQSFNADGELSCPVTLLLVLMCAISAATPIDDASVFPVSFQCDCSRHTWSKTDIVEGELSYTWVELQKEGEWLSNTT